MFEGLNEKEMAEITTLLRQSGSANRDEAFAAQRALAAAVTTPLRQGILVGDTITNVFQYQKFDPGARIEYPIDFFRPDNANEFVAITLPNHGKIPQRQIDGDYVTVPTFPIGAGIDWLLRYAREARWDIVGRALEVLEAGFTKKMNDDGWHTILKAGFDRNIVIGDSNAVAGQFTKRLVSLMKLVMRRNAGGNSTSINRGKLTDLYVSPESLEDIRNWGFDEIDDQTRNKIFNAGEDGIIDIFGTKIHALDELGEGQEYQTFYTDVIAASDVSNHGMCASDVEILIGLDLDHRDAFVMPVREELSVFADDSLHREQRAGLYGWSSLGYGVLNNARVLLGSV